MLNGRLLSAAMPNPQRGETWWVNWSGGRGSEQAGRRPALVVQTDAANQNPRYPNTIVVAISTKGRQVPFHILIQPAEGNGLTMPSYVKCEQILTISKGRLEERMGRLSEQEMERVKEALSLVLDI